MSFVDGVNHFIEGFGNDPTFTAEHARNVGLEHVQRVVNCLLAKDNPRPAFSVLGQHLAQTEASVLVLQKDSAGIDKLLCVFGEHLVDGRSIVHVGERVTVGTEGIADLLELGLDGLGLVKDDEDRLLNQLAIFGVSNWLLDGGEAHVAVTTGGTEDHALETNLLFSGHNTGDGRETHVQVPGTGTALGLPKGSQCGLRRRGSRRDHQW